MHLPRARTRERSRGRVPGGVLAAAQGAVKSGLSWASAQLSTISLRPPMADLLPFRVSTGDLLEEIDDPAPQLGIRNPHKRLGQRQAVGGREKIGHVGGGRGLFEAFGHSSSR